MRTLFFIVLMALVAGTAYSDILTDDPRIVQRDDTCFFKMVPANDERVEDYMFCCDDPFIGLVRVGEVTVADNMCALIPASGQFIDLGGEFFDCGAVTPSENISFGALKSNYR